MKKAGLIIYSIPLLAFGLGHLTNAGQMVGMVPSWMPFGVVWVYLTGLALIAAAVSFLINKKVELAGKLLALMLIIFVVTMHIPSLIAGNESAMPMVFKDLAMAGAALYFSATANS
ncbi:MAG: DoxX family protein [Cyclobacteriaceae bacterium]|nr:DoxX family protein [Cyclobacteriaceae bacterium]